MTTYNYKATNQRLVYAVDFDGTLTTGNLLELEPNNKMLKAVRKKYFAGHIIIIWTARIWTDIQEVIVWLEENQVPYHGIKMNKGGADYYIDDKMQSIKEFTNE